MTTSSSISSSTTSPMYDAETGLPGRALLTDRILMALRGAERTGHEVGVVLVAVTSIENPEAPVTPGDRVAVLREVGTRLGACVRGVDSVGRLGSTAFALVLQGDLGEEGLRVLARRVLFELSPPVAVGLRQHFVTARLGGTTAVAGLDAPSSLLQRAGEALAQAQRPDADLFVLRPPDH